MRAPLGVLAFSTELTDKGIFGLPAKITPVLFARVGIDHRRVYAKGVIVG